MAEIPGEERGGDIFPDMASVYQTSSMRPKGKKKAKAVEVGHDSHKVVMWCLF